MPTTVGPQTLTVGQPNTVVDPNQRGGNPSAAVQIQNSSPYQLNVTAAGEQLSIQPFFAQTVPISSAPISITPLAVAGLSAACIVTLSFLLGTPAGTGIMLPDGSGWVEAPPQQDGPLTAAAIASALSTQGTVDLLASGGPTAVTGAPSQLPAALVAGTHAYATLILLFKVYTVGGTEFSACAIRQDTAGNVTAYPTISNANAFGAIGSDAMFLPVASIAGDLLGVDIAASNNGNLTWVLYGSTVPVPAPYPTRRDGRPYPLGRNLASLATASGAGGTLIAAPATPKAILLKTLHMVCTGGGGSCGAIIGGVPATLLFGGGGGNNAPLVIPETGLLLDPATAVTIPAVAGVTNQASATYDIVV